MYGTLLADNELAVVNPDENFNRALGQLGNADDVGGRSRSGL
jgi:hypothetical protein